MVFELSVLSHDDFREVFAEEIWELILDELLVLSVEDVEHLRKSSPFFRRLLERKKVTALFPQVLDVLRKTGYIIPKKYIWYPMDEEYFPILRPNTEIPHNAWYIGFMDSRKPREILTLRRVCKMWRTSVDNLYRKKLYRGRSYHIPWGLAFEETFQSNRNQHYLGRKCISKFLTHFHGFGGKAEGSVGCSPFLLKSCTFKFSSLYNHLEKDFISEISTLLLKYGGHLEKCTFDFLLVKNCLYYLGHVPGWLELLPNLKKLKIISWEQPSDTPPGIDLALGEPFLRQCLPRMESMDDLVLEKVDDPLASCLLQANNHITRLDLTYSKNQAGCAVVKALPNLTSLKVTLHNTAQFDRFETFQLDSSLKTLELLLYFVDYPPSHIFYVLEKLCGSTLENLSLTLIRGERTTGDELEAQILQDCDNLQKLHLPYLTRLQVSVKEARQRGVTSPENGVQQPQMKRNWRAIISQVLFYFSMLFYVWCLWWVYKWMRLLSSKFKL